LGDTQRIEEIRRSFEAKGWRLSVEDERDCWVAWFFKEEHGPVITDVVYRRTALGAALAAWEKFKGEPYVGLRPVE